MNVQSIVRAFGLAAVCGVALYGQTASANLVTNGGFETGDFTGWTVSLAPVGSSLSISTPQHSGLFAASFSADGGQNDLISQMLATTPGQDYLIEFYVLNLGVENDNLFIQFGDTIVHNEGVKTELETYVYRSFIATAGGALTMFTIGGYDGNAAFLLDDISVTAVPAPGVAAAFAMLALTGARRRRTT